MANNSHKRDDMSALACLEVLTNGAVLSVRAIRRHICVGPCWAFALTLLALGISETRSQEKQADIYRDRNGYFVVVKPTGWGQQDYPEETIRSKVAFVHPTYGRVSIRVISGPAPGQSYSLEDWYTENQRKISSELRPRFPTGEFTIRKERIGERVAVVHRNSASGLGEQEAVAFVDGGRYFLINITMLVVWFSFAFAVIRVKPGISGVLIGIIGGGCVAICVPLSCGTLANILGPLRAAVVVIAGSLVFSILFLNAGCRSHSQKPADSPPNSLKQ